MEKRLCDLCELVENNKYGAVLAVKEDTQPFDLIRLGGFDGDERMFRMSKDPDTVSITVFRDGRPPYTMSYGASNSLVTQSEKRVRNQVMECVNLDFGIFTDRPFGGKDFDLLVGETCGERTLDSPRHFELQHGAGYFSLFVNGQHIALIDKGKLESWLDERNIRLDITRSNGRTDWGTMRRRDVPIREEQSVPHTVIARFGTTALVFTGLESPEPYVVARGYGEERGDWLFGTCHANLAAAWEEAGGEPARRRERPLDEPAKEAGAGDGEEPGPTDWQRRPQAAGAWAANNTARGELA